MSVKKGKLQSADAFPAGAEPDTARIRLGDNEGNGVIFAPFPSLSLLLVLHIQPQQSIDASLFALTLLFEPHQYVRVEPNRYRLFTR